jgi:ribonuclease-3
LMLNSFKRFSTLFSSDKEFYKSMKNIFGFYPENIFLYKLALRHKSTDKQTFNGLRLNNERLEFLGDAIIDAIVADYLFKKFPMKEEGFLTETRSKIVSRQQLNKLSQKIGINSLISTGNEAFHFKSINGDAFEALIGAIYLDKGYQFAYNILVNRIINIHLDIDNLVNTDFNFKSRLIEWGQKEKHSVVFSIANESGASHQKLYEIEVLIDNEVMGSAEDFSIKGAEQLAAEKVLLKLKSGYSAGCVPSSN